MVVVRSYVLGDLSMTKDEFIDRVFQINSIGRPSAAVDALDRLCREANGERGCLDASPTFSERNLKRCEAPKEVGGFGHPLHSWSLSDWFLATLGELGEAANVAKKLNRYRDGIAGNKETQEALEAKLAAELGDTAVYLDLLCQTAGLDFETVREASFQSKSKELGYVE